MLSFVDVGRPLGTDEPPTVSLSGPSVTLQPALGVLSPPDVSPPLPLPPAASPPPLPTFPPVAAPPEPSALAPPLAVPPLEFEPPDAVAPPLAVLPPVAAFPDPPLPSRSEVPGVVLQPMIPIDRPTTNVRRHFVFIEFSCEKLCWG